MAIFSKRVDDLVKIAQDSGFGNPVGSEGPVIGAEESVAGVPVGPVSEIGREVAPTSGVVVSDAHKSNCAKENNDAPRVGPPGKGDPIPEDTPELVTVAPPCIFQTGAAYFRSKRPLEAAFGQWPRRTLHREDGGSAGGNRFRYWAFNTNGRFADARQWKSFLKQAPCAADLDLTTLSMDDKKSIVGKMVALTGSITETIGDAYMARRELE